MISNFLIDEKNSINLKNIVLKNLKLHFEDLTNKLSVDTKNININSKDLLITKDSNITLGNLKLAKPTIKSFRQQK